MELPEPLGQAANADAGANLKRLVVEVALGDTQLRQVFRERAVHWNGATAKHLAICDIRGKVRQGGGEPAALGALPEDKRQVGFCLCKRFEFCQMRRIRFVPHTVDQRDRGCVSWQRLC